MSEPVSKRSKQSAVAPSELMILPDGQILAHVVTPETATLLATLNPEDERMNARAAWSHRRAWSSQPTHLATHYVSRTKPA